MAYVGIIPVNKPRTAGVARYAACFLIRCDISINVSHVILGNLETGVAISLAVMKRTATKTMLYQQRAMGSL